MNFSLPNRLYIGFSVAILLVFLSGLLSYQTFQRQLEAGNWVEHTYQVLNQARAIEKLIADMETGRIGYRSTGIEQFLNAHNDAGTAAFKLGDTVPGFNESLATLRVGEKATIVFPSKAG